MSNDTDLKAAEDWLMQKPIPAAKLRESLARFRAEAVADGLRLAAERLESNARFTRGMAKKFVANALMKELAEQIEYDAKTIRALADEREGK